MQTINIKTEKSAFTLIEFVMVIAIISMISVTLGVSIVTFNPRRLENEVQKLVGDLSLARAMAISTGSVFTGYNYRVDFDIDANGAIDAGDNNTYIIYRVNPLDNGTTVVKRGVLRLDDATGSINVTHGLNAPIVITSFEFVSPQGGLNVTISDPLTIHLQRSGAAAEITVRNLTGHISWQRL